MRLAACKCLREFLHTSDARELHVMLNYCRRGKFEGLPEERTIALDSRFLYLRTFFFWNWFSRRLLMIKVNGVNN
jgi:hypothetical protein